MLIREKATLSNDMLFSCGKPEENGTKAKPIGCNPKATVHLKAYE